MSSRPQAHFADEDTIVRLYSAPSSPRQAILELSHTPEKFMEVTADALVGALNYVLDGEPDLSCLEACEQAFIGVKFEKNFLQAFGLPRNTKALKKERKGRGQKTLDTAINGTSLDIKFTVGNNWMIPPENLGEWCMLFKADFKTLVFSVGVLHLDPVYLTRGMNRDLKRSISRDGKKKIDWIVSDHPLLRK